MASQLPIGPGIRVKHLYAPRDSHLQSVKVSILTLRHKS